MLTLLGDEDDSVVKTIRGHILSAGPEGMEFLGQNTLHPDPLVRRRVLDIIDKSEADRRDAEFMAFVLSQGEHFDLEEGIWKFTLTTYPRINIDGFKAQLDDWTKRTRTVMGHSAGPGIAIDALNEVLFRQLGFVGNEADYFNPENSYLNRVMDLRRGIPISLCLVYLLIGKRLGLPLVGIGMPGHFICRWQTATEEVFIDPFHSGRLLTRSECRKRLQDLAIEYDDRHLAPLSHRRTLTRVVANLHLIYKERRETATVERLLRYLIALSR
jgi:regulator of sirC expression with transglutaminase-like and TPR domain